MSEISKRGSIIAEASRQGGFRNVENFSQDLKDRINEYNRTSSGSRVDVSMERYLDELDNGRVNR
jgi:predicted Rdx family selenoprotein